MDERNEAAAREVRWAALELTLPADAESDAGDSLLALLGPRALGVEQHVDRAGGQRLVFYFDELAQATAAAQEASAVAARCGAPGSVAATRSVEDARWAETYQAGLRPFALGRDFTVYPAGDDLPDEPDQRAIRLVPGRAFGTGEHATTRLCAEELERRVRPGSRWVDLGCGSGILTVVACRLGAERVVALDTDVEAVKIARGVLAANGTQSQAWVAQGSARSVGPEIWDGVVANIELGFFLAEAASFAALPAVGGSVIVSGFAPADAEEVRRTLAPVGLKAVGRRQEGQWAAMTLRRESP